MSSRRQASPGLTPHSSQDQPPLVAQQTADDPFSAAGAGSPSALHPAYVQSPNNSPNAVERPLSSSSVNHPSPMLYSDDVVVRHLKDLSHEEAFSPEAFTSVPLKLKIRTTLPREELINTDSLYAVNRQRYHRLLEARSALSRNQPPFYSPVDQFAAEECAGLFEDLSELLCWRPYEVDSGRHYGRLQTSRYSNILSQICQLRVSKLTRLSAQTQSLWDFPAWGAGILLPSDFLKYSDFERVAVMFRDDVENYISQIYTLAYVAEPRARHSSTLPTDSSRLFDLPITPQRIPQPRARQGTPWARAERDTIFTDSTPGSRAPAFVTEPNSIPHQKQARFSRMEVMSPIDENLVTEPRHPSPPTDISFHPPTELQSSYGRMDETPSRLPQATAQAYRQSGAEPRMRRATLAPTPHTTSNLLDMTSSVAGVPQPSQSRSLASDTRRLQAQQIAPLAYQAASDMVFEYPSVGITPSTRQLSGSNALREILSDSDAELYSRPIETLPVRRDQGYLPHQRRTRVSGGGGGPPDDSDSDNMGPPTPKRRQSASGTGRSQTAASRDPPGAARVAQFDLKLKTDAIPMWDGNTDTLLVWLQSVNQLSKRSEVVYQQLGEIVPTRFTDRALRWFFSLDRHRQQEIMHDWRSMKRAITSHFMNRAWLEDMKRRAIRARYRERGHDQERPSDYCIRKQQLLSVTHELTQSELISEIMAGAPSSWLSLLHTELYATVEQLLNAIQYHELALTNHSLLGSSSAVRSMEKRLERLEAKGERKSSSSSARPVNRFSRPPRAYATEANLKPSPKPVKEHPFAKDDSRVSKGRTPKDLGIRGCRYCGSLNHWDKDCRHATKNPKRTGRPRANLASISDESVSEEETYDALYETYREKSDSDNPESENDSDYASTVSGTEGSPDDEVSALN